MVALAQQHRPHAGDHWARGDTYFEREDFEMKFLTSFSVFGFPFNKLSLICVVPQLREGGGLPSIVSGETIAPFTSPTSAT